MTWALRRGRFTGAVVRAVPPVWAHKPASGKGAARRGGRFNPIGVPALYTSLNINTAAKEVRFALNKEPYTFYFLKIDCETILDLTDTRVRAANGISWVDLECPNWESGMTSGREPASHRVYRQLRANGIAGILVNSFADGATPDDINLVLWRWRDVTRGASRSPRKISVINADGLLSRPG